VVTSGHPPGRVLLQRRRDTGQWAIPMGKQELGETPLAFERYCSLLVHFPRLSVAQRPD